MAINQQRKSVPAFMLVLLIPPTLDAVRKDDDKQIKQVSGNSTKIKKISSLYLLKLHKKPTSWQCSQITRSSKLNSIRFWWLSWLGCKLVSIQRVQQDKFEIKCLHNLQNLINPSTLLHDWVASSQMFKLFEILYRVASYLQFVLFHIILVTISEVKIFFFFIALFSSEFQLKNQNNFKWAKKCWKWV